LDFDFFWAIDDGVNPILPGFDMSSVWCIP
jgi:hypothetical protein